MICIYHKRIPQSRIRHQETTESLMKQGSYEGRPVRKCTGSHGGWRSCQKHGFNLQIKGTDKKPEALSGLIAKVDKSNVYQTL